MVSKQCYENHSFWFVKLWICKGKFLYRFTFQNIFTQLDQINQELITELSLTTNISRTNNNFNWQQCGNKIIAKWINFCMSHVTQKSKHCIITWTDEVTSPPIDRTSGFLGSGRCKWRGRLLFSICHFCIHWGSWMEIDFVPNSRPHM